MEERGCRGCLEERDGRGCFAGRIWRGWRGCLDMGRGAMGMDRGSGGIAAENSVLKLPPVPVRGEGFI